MNGGGDLRVGPGLLLAKRAKTAGGRRVWVALACLPSTSTAQTPTTLPATPASTSQTRQLSPSTCMLPHLTLVP